MKKLAIYKAEVLHASETFIREQALSYTNWSPVLIGMRRVEGLPLDGLTVRLLDNQSIGGKQRHYERVLRGLLSVAPRRFVRAMHEENPAVLHIHFGTDAVDFWPVARRLGIPVVVTLHGYDISIHREHWESGTAGFRMRFYPRRLVEMSQHPQVRFVAVSDAIRQSALDFGLRPDHVVTRYIGVDCNDFQPGGEPIERRARRILFVGRLVEKKGLCYLIDALAQVRASVPDAELIVVGDGPLRGDLEAQAKRLSAPVQFLGQQTAAQVRAELARTRVFCLPSITAGSGETEGFPLVLLEAQACGVPIVTSARGGVTEGLLPGVTGFPAAERSVADLTRGLTQLLSDDALAARMSVAAAGFMREHFELRSCTRRLESLYDELLEPAGLGSKVECVA